MRKPCWKCAIAIGLILAVFLIYISIVNPNIMSIIQTGAPSGVSGSQAQAAPAIRGG